MNESSIQIATLAIQVILLLVVLFGAGKYIGATNQILKQVQNSQLEAKDQLEEHRKEDKETFDKFTISFSEFTKDINDIKVSVARYVK